MTKERHEIPEPFRSTIVGLKALIRERQQETLMLEGTIRRKEQEIQQANHEMQQLVDLIGGFLQLSGPGYRLSDCGCYISREGESSEPDGLARRLD